MLDWIREHPYLSGTLAVFLVVLFLVFRARSSGGSAAAQVQSGPSEGLQAASLQAQVQTQGIQAASDIQSQQTAAALAAHLADVEAQNATTSAARTVALQNILTSGETQQYATAAQLQASQSHDLSQADIAATVAGAQVEIAGFQIPLAQIGSQRDIALAGIQAPILEAQIAAALEATKSTNATSVDLATINANRDTTLNAQTIGGAVDIATLQTGVQNNYINTQGFLASKTLDVTHDLEAANLNYNKNTLDQILAQLQAGTYNKGGEGGANQVQIVTSIFGKTTAPGVIEPGNSPASIISSFGTLFAGLGQGLMGGAKVAAAV
jgi:hypothetical protein